MKNLFENKEVEAVQSNLKMLYHAVLKKIISMAYGLLKPDSSSDIMSFTFWSYTVNHALKKLCLAGLLAAPTVYAGGPLPDVYQEVTGPRETGPSGVGTIGPSTPLPSPLGGGGPAGKGAINGGGHSKASEKKQESEQGKNSWWQSIASVFQVAKGRLRTMFTGSFTGVSKSETFGPDGQIIERKQDCLEIAVNTENKESCTTIIVRGNPDGTKSVEIQRLIKRGYWDSLIVSSDDTIFFKVNSFDEVLGLLSQVDNRFGN